MREPLTTTDSTGSADCACCACALGINTVRMAVAEQPSISFCTRLFMHSPYIFCSVFSWFCFFPEERYELRSLIIVYSLRVMKQSQYMQDGPRRTMPR